MTKERICANGESMSKRTAQSIQTKATIKKKKQAKTDEAWDEIIDGLKLALDQAQTGPRDQMGTRHLAMHLRPILKLAHTQLEVLS